MKRILIATLIVASLATVAHADGFGSSFFGGLLGARLGSRQRVIVERQVIRQPVVVQQQQFVRQRYVQQQQFVAPQKVYVQRQFVQAYAQPVIVQPQVQYYVAPQAVVLPQTGACYSQQLNQGNSCQQFFQSY